MPKSRARRSRHSAAKRRAFPASSGSDMRTASIFGMSMSEAAIWNIA